MGRGQIHLHDRLAGAVAVGARTFLRLQLEELYHPHRLAGRGHHPQIAAGGDEHDPGGRHVEYLDTAVGEQREQVDDVEFVDQRVGQLHQCPDQQTVVGHVRVSLRRPTGFPDSQPPASVRLRSVPRGGGAVASVRPSGGPPGQ